MTGRARWICGLLAAAGAVNLSIAIWIVAHDPGRASDLQTIYDWCSQWLRGGVDLYALQDSASSGDTTISYIRSNIGTQLGGVDYATAAVIEGKGQNSLVTVQGAQTRPTIALWASILRTCLPDATSHRRSVSSQPPDASVLPLGENTTAVSAPVWPLNAASSLPLATSHTRTTRSLPA